MVVVPLPKTADHTGTAARGGDNSRHWVGMVAAGTLAASGVLLVAGKRRAGLVTALSGAALAMIDQQDVVNRWWNALPSYLDEMQNLLGRAQTAVEDLSTQGDKLRHVLGR